MRTPALSLIALCFFLLVPYASLHAEGPAAEDQPAAVPVRVVVLYSSGVGYFEHLGQVNGETSAELRFKATQINDILKSLVLQDLDGGTITTVTYPSQDPLDKTLASFQVDITGNPSLAELLNQLRGARVTGQVVGGDTLAGTIIGVEAQQRATVDGGEPVTVHLLNLFADGAIRSVELGQLSRLELEDRLLQQELEKALTALSQARGRDSKPVAIHFSGKGERRVRLGYVVETPVWKTSYRLILPAGEEEKPILQGWAIVENQTDTDWRDVQLSLVSGRPISFVQDLYQPLYIPRPVVKPELYSSLLPQEYQPGMGRMMLEQVDEVAADALAPLPQAAMALSAEQVAGVPRSARFKAEAGYLSAMGGGGINATESVAAAATSAQLGELFQYTVAAPVSLARQKSAMLPILNDAVEAERVSIYNAAVLPRNPLNGTILKNTSDKHLLQGPITVFEAGAYAGDAKIGDLPPGQERLLSFGIDLQVLVDQRGGKDESTIETGKIVRGVLEVARKRQFSQEYLVENRADRDKVMVIEHPLRSGWKLVSPTEPMETTDLLYRFRLAVAAGGHGELTVREEITDWERAAILPLDLQALTVFSKNAALPQVVRDGLAGAVALKQEMVEAQRRLDENRRKTEEISRAQQRTRENMQAVDSRARQGDYYNRLLQRLAAQDGELDALQNQADDLQLKFNTARKQLEEYLTNLTVG
ncbi:MAG: DUF4139 domain-containing protein [Desulforhopalus sp.]|nr:DUF4139 domain-containing protein [Desulforhopalus sp.]